ncbi:CARDB domain-containing protein [Haloferax chudinovii]|uniref:CARDB domain-containing protein n=1 Tax=Haloferax chudinovii TaxID=1109010 RepID=A0ABD5XNH4_9EURY
MTESRGVRPAIAGAVALLAVTSILVGGPSAVSAQSGQIVVNSTTVEPSEPYVGESVTVRATVSNFESSSGGVNLREVTLRSGGSIVAEANKLGTLGPGGSVDVPLSTTFTSPGEKQLTVHVSGRHENGNVINVEYPVIVEVEERDVRAGLSVTEQTNDSVNVELTNYGNTNLSGVEIVASVNDSEVARRYTSNLDPDTNRSVVFDTADMSDQVVLFTATYTVDGETYTTSLSKELDDDSVPGEIQLTSIETTRSAGSVTIQGDAANIGNTDASSVLLTVKETANVSHGSPSGGYFVGRVEASEFATFDLTAQFSGEPTTVPIEVSYIVDGDRVTTTQEVPLDAGGTAAVADGPQSNQGPGSNESSSGGSQLPVPVIGGVLVVVVLGGVGIYRWRQH